MVSSTTDGRDELAEGISATPLAAAAFSSSAMPSACCEICRISENWGRARLTGRKWPSESALSHFPRSLVSGRRSPVSRIRRQRSVGGPARPACGHEGRKKRTERRQLEGQGWTATRLERSGRVEKGMKRSDPKKTPRVGRWTQGRDGGFGDAWGGVYRPRFSDQRCTTAATDSLSGLF